MSASSPIADQNAASGDEANGAAQSESAVEALDVLRAVDFDWTLHLASVWAVPRYDVDGLHAEVRRELVAALDGLASNADPRSPLGRVVIGSGGTGKTHLLSVLRRAATDRGCSFILIDMTAVREFPTTVLQGIVDSLGRMIDGPDGQQPQYRMLLSRLLSTFDLAEPVSRSIEKLQRFGPERLLRNTALLLTALSRRHPSETMQFQDALRALLALNSNDLEISSLGLRWLQASELETDERQLLGFTRSLNEPFEIVRAMSWLMSLCGPTVIAFDQLDPIVHQLQLANGQVDAEESQSVLAARSIVEQIAGGLSALRDVTRRTLLVVSCVEATLDVLRRHALRQDLDRFDAPLILGSMSDDVVARSIVRQRLNAAFERTGYTPPWPTWPFRSEVFDGLQGVSAREILRLCAEHRRRCLTCGEVVELSSFDSGEPPLRSESLPDAAAEDSRQPSLALNSAAGESVAPSELQALDAEVDRLKGEVDPADLLSKLHDDERLGPLLQAACRCLIREWALPVGVDAGVETDFGNPKLPPLHARLRLIQASDDTERHLCLRALQRDNATAFQTRLQAALTASGISSDLPFRRLAIIRRGDPPSGPATEQLLNVFSEAGGRLVSPTDDDLRTLRALQQLEATQPLGFMDWLKQRRPVSSLSAFQDLAANWLP